MALWVSYTLELCQIIDNQGLKAEIDWNYILWGRRCRKILIGCDVRVGKIVGDRG